VKLKLFFVLLVVSLLVGCDNKKEDAMTYELDGMLSYTIDGESTSEQPSKESGYIVNKIICDSDMDLMWDNDNWEVEFTNISSGKCTIDFTKDTSTQGYRVTVTSNVPSSLDSLSKSSVENGTVKIYSKSKIESVTGCNALIEDNKVIVSNITKNETCNITVEDKTLAGILKIAYPPKAGRTNFSAIDNGTPALYTDTDDQGTTYYFSGDGSQMNNWVSYAGKMWRIIRINGNGSVRLLYAGTGGEDGYIGSEQKYNDSRNHPGYVGWKYSTGSSLDAIRGNANKSNAYTTVENWYNALSTTDKNYIDGNAIYCNDRNIGSGSFSTGSQFYYAAYARLIPNKAPTFECSNTSDRFYNFGLMTADEVSYAGGVYLSNNPGAYYYLNASGGSLTGSSCWWTMSPYDSSGYVVFAFSVRGSDYLGRFNSNGVHATNVVRPVVSLKPEVMVTGGDGSANNPYELTL